MSAPQTYKNHTRWFPPFHFFAAPILLLNVFLSIAATIHHWPQHRVLFLWWIVVSFALLVLALSSRVQALRAQDRIIRLEERLRYQTLLSADDLASSQNLTLRQIIGLRFASDEELAGLLRRAVAENLSEKQIKQAVVHWRADTYRV